MAQHVEMIGFISMQNRFIQRAHGNNHTSPNSTSSVVVVVVGDCCGSLTRSTVTLASQYNLSPEIGKSRTSVVTKLILYPSPQMNTVHGLLYYLI